MNKALLWTFFIVIALLAAGCAAKAPAALPDASSNPTASAAPSPAATQPAQSGEIPPPGGSAAPDEEAEQEYAPAPDFTLTDLDGNSHTLSDYQGEIVILNFWASWCGPCKEEMPEYDQMNRELLESGKARLLTINITDGIDETEDSARAFIDKNGYTMTTLLDIDGEAANLYQAYSIPTTVVINREGLVVGYQAGALTKDDVLSFIEALP